MSFPSDINKILSEISKEIVNTLDPELILIAGSFGKQSWIYSGEELLSDFEIVFVCDKPWSRKKKKILLTRLNEEFPIEISLKGFIRSKVKAKSISNYTNHYPGYLSLDFYDTFYKPSLLYSKSTLDFEVECSQTEIPKWEAWRLYVNRIGDLLKIKDLDSFSQVELRYYWMKVFESTADSYLIMHQVYDKNINVRVNRFTSNLLEKDMDLPSDCKESFTIINKSLKARKNHDLNEFDVELKFDTFSHLVASWLGYFESKLFLEEKGESNSNDDFYDSYLKNVRFGKKYSSFRSNGILKSNMIRLAANTKLFNKSFKFYNMNVSWRHVILLSISSAFREKMNRNEDYHQTKEITQSIFRKNTLQMNENDYVSMIIQYWKILR